MPEQQASNAEKPRNIRGNKALRIAVILVLLAIAITLYFLI